MSEFILKNKTSKFTGYETNLGLEVKAGFPMKMSKLKESYDWKIGRSL